MAGLHAALGVMMALRARESTSATHNNITPASTKPQSNGGIGCGDRKAHNGGTGGGLSGGGQVVDVALYESIFNVMEAVIPEYTGAGVIREPSGTTVSVS